MNKSEQCEELFTALSLAQSKMKGALKDSENPFYKSKFADLGSVWEACRGPLTENGLSIIQSTCMSADGLLLQTTLCHASGQYFSSTLPVRPMKDDPQAMGSALSYARRYALSAMVGIYQVDDDAEGAMHRPLAPQKQPFPARIAPPSSIAPTPALKTAVKAAQADQLKAANIPGQLNPWDTGEFRGK